MKWTPKHYQEHALAEALDAALSRRRGFALWMEMGLGKTSVAATMVAELLDMGRANRILVVAPRRVCESVWPAELAKWEHLRTVPVRRIQGTPAQRARMLAEPWHGIELVTYELLTWLFRDALKGRRLPWQVLILDESSKMKASGTQRFRALRRRVAEFLFVLELTGSPAPQGLLNLWAPAFLLDGGERLGRNYPAYRERWFESDYMGWKYTPREGAAEQIHAQLRDITLSMRAADYLELPELVENDIWVRLPQDVRALYGQMEEEMYLELAAGTVEVANGGVLTGKCRQAANGFLYTNGRNDQWQDIHDAKVEALRDVVEECEGEPLLVAYQFKADLARLQRAFPEARPYDTKQDEVDWNVGRIPMFLIHPASAGHGLNLQDGGQRIALFGVPWSTEQYEQVIDRIAGGLRRQRTTFVHRIGCAGTVDEQVLEAVTTNRAVQDVLKDALRRRRAA